MNNVVITIHCDSSDTKTSMGFNAKKYILTLKSDETSEIILYQVTNPTSLIGLAMEACRDMVAHGVIPTVEDPDKVLDAFKARTNRTFGTGDLSRFVRRDKDGNRLPIPLADLRRFMHHSAAPLREATRRFAEYSPKIEIKKSTIKPNIAFKQTSMNFKLTALDRI